MGARRELLSDEVGKTANIGSKVTRSKEASPHAKTQDRDENSSSTHSHCAQDLFSEIKMAVAKAADARLVYLNQISSALAFKSPIISSHIYVSARKLGEGITDLENSHNHCSACGRSLVPAWSFEYVQNAQKRTRQDRLHGPCGTVAKTKIRCNTCGSVQELYKAESKPAELKPSRTHTLSATPISSLEPPPTANPSPILQTAPAVPSASTPTATRKRPRSKNASLQALLAKSRPQASKPPGFGLDFADLLKG